MNRGFERILHKKLNEKLRVCLSGAVEGTDR